METGFYAAVCDNDRFAAEAVAEVAVSLFREAGVCVRADTFTDTDALYRKMQETPYRLLLLDIDMPGTSGIEFSKRLREEGNDVDIVFVSYYEKLVFESFAVNPFGFVRKSNLRKDFQACVDAFLKKQKKKDMPKFVVRQGDRDITISGDDVVYIESFRKQQTVHLKDQPETLVLTSTMEYLESVLADYGFLRINHGCLVNYEYIYSVRKDEIELRGGVILQVSRRRSQTVRERYFELMRANGNLVF